MINRIIEELKGFVRPELHDPVNTVGCGMAVAGGMLMFSILTDKPAWLFYIGVGLWLIGIIVLYLHGK